MNVEVLLQIIAMLAPLSLVSVGGALTIVPEIHRQVVEVYGWMTDAEFVELFALAQASPGPNILVVSLIGWKIAGGPGAVVALLSIVTPSSLLTLAIIQVWRRLGNAPWLRAIQAGLAPIAVGAVLAGGVVVGSAAITSITGILVAAVALVLFLRTGIHPLLVMAGAGGLALLGWL